MKTRLFVACVSALGLVLCLSWVIAAQAKETPAFNKLGQQGSAVSHNEDHLRHPNAAGLSSASDITFTPPFTVYLPLLERGQTQCLLAPTLISPANGADLDTLIPLFEWNNGNDPNTIGVNLEVALDPGFTQQVWSDFYFFFTPFKPDHDRLLTNFDPATTYYWRTFLACANGSQSPYSEARFFMTGSGGTILPAPTLLSPSSGTVLPTTTVTLHWSGVSGAVEYQVHRRTTNTGVIWRVMDTQATINGLNPNTTYAWWAAARNDYAWGNDSVHWTFTTGAAGVRISRNLQP